MSKYRMESAHLIARKPSRPASLASDVIRPMAQALVTAFIVGGMVLWLVLGSEWPPEWTGVACRRPTDPSA